MAIFGPKARNNGNFFTFSTLCFYSLERCFLVLEYRKTHFPGLYCLKKKVEKMAIFGPKPWVNPFGKKSIFRVFELCVFIAQKGFFLVLEYRKRYFPGLYCLQKQSSKNGPFQQTKSMQKCQFFNCLKFSFLQPRKVFFCSRVSKNTFSWRIMLKKKKLKKKGHF